MQVPVLTVTLSPTAGSRVSFQEGHNKVIVKYTSSMSLVYSEIRITKGGADYDIGVGELAYHESGNIPSNVQQTCEVTVDSSTFAHGDGLYTLSLYAKNQPDGAWSEYHYFLTVDGVEFIPMSDEHLEVVTDQEVPTSGPKFWQNGAYVNIPIIEAVYNESESRYYFEEACSLDNSFTKYARPYDNSCYAFIDLKTAQGSTANYLIIAAPSATAFNMSLYNVPAGTSIGSDVPSVYQISNMQMSEYGSNRFHLVHLDKPLVQNDHSSYWCLIRESDGTADISLNTLLNNYDGIHFNV